MAFEFQHLHKIYTNGKVAIEDLNLNSADVLVPLIPGNESGYDSSVFVLPKEEAEVAPKPAQSTNTTEEVQIVFSVP